MQSRLDRAAMVPRSVETPLQPWTQSMSGSAPDRRVCIHLRREEEKIENAMEGFGKVGLLNQGREYGERVYGGGDGFIPWLFQYDLITRDMRGLFPQERKFGAGHGIWGKGGGRFKVS